MGGECEDWDVLWIFNDFYLGFAWFDMIFTYNDLFCDIFFNPQR